MRNLLPFLRKLRLVLRLAQLPRHPQLRPHPRQQLRLLLRRSRLPIPRHHIIRTKIEPAHSLARARNPNHQKPCVARRVRLDLGGEGSSIQLPSIRFQQDHSGSLSQRDSRIRKRRR